MLPRPLDITLAYKGISLHPDLSSGDKRVAAAIIDHFNHKSSRCDPGIERLARLLGISERTVIRSTQRLERLRLIRKRRHGGHFNCNSYEPVWCSFRELEAKWNTRFNANSWRSRPAQETSSDCQSSHPLGVIPVTQTRQTNPSKETCTLRTLPEKVSAGAELKGHPRDIVRRFPHHQGSRRHSQTSKSALEAAYAAAERRWNKELLHQLAASPTVYADIIEAIDSQLANAATEAEMRRHGAGLAHVLNELRRGKR